MLRVVFDTNVLVSALANKSGIPGRIYDFSKQNAFQLITSSYIIEELAKTLENKFKNVSKAEIETHVKLLYDISEVVHPLPLSHSKILPNDWPILGTALAGKADFLVTGDNLILRIKSYKGTKILTPRDFYELFV